MNKNLRQIYPELLRFLQQNHTTLDELYTLFPNQQFPISKKPTLDWDAGHREDLTLEYLPDPSQESVYTERFEAQHLAQLLKEETTPFLLYVMIREVSPLFSGLYRYRETERALELLSEPSQKLLEKFPILQEAPLTFFFALSSTQAEQWGSQRFLLPALLHAGKVIERWSHFVPVKVHYNFDGQELLTRLELSTPLVLLVSIAPKTQAEPLS